MGTIKLYEDYIKRCYKRIDELNDLARETQSDIERFRKYQSPGFVKKSEDAVEFYKNHANELQTAINDIQNRIDNDASA